MCYVLCAQVQEEQPRSLLGGVIEAISQQEEEERSHTYIHTYMHTQPKNIHIQIHFHTVHIKILS